MITRTNFRCPFTIKPVEVGYTNAMWDPQYCNCSDNDIVKDGKQYVGGI